MSDDLEGFAEWRDKIESRVSTLEVTVKTEARVRVLNCSAFREQM